MSQGDDETVIQWLCSLLSKDKKVAPIKQPKLCLHCFEQGAKNRICCNGMFCDHCYAKDKACPNCKSATRVEKMTGATYMLPTFSENEECRACLDPGLKRRCCGNYYCDDCYYKLPNCRACDAAVGYKGGISEEMKAYLIAILLGWLTTIFIVAAIIALFASVGASEAQTPLGISDYSCFGVFKRCDSYVCIDVDNSVANGTSAIPPLSSWKYCDDATTTKLEGYACVFDEQLMSITDKAMGFDICASSFYDGVFVFEDTFESWRTFDLSSNTMTTAAWNSIHGGYATSICGVGELLGGYKALTFSGQDERYAETNNVDVSSGGWVELELFLPPPGIDTTNKLCKSMYNGIVYIDWSTDDGITWHLLKSFDGRFTRATKFIKVKEELPLEARSNQTRIKIREGSFTDNADYWAIDNFRILRYLPSDWDTARQFRDNIGTTREVMQRAQCCADTDWCETRLSQKQMDSCDSEFSWYDGRKYLLRGAEFYICLAVFLVMLKFIYTAVQDYLLHKRLPFLDEYNELADIDRLMKLIPPRYRPKKKIQDYTSDIHKSARLVAEMKDMFNDEEGIGELKKTKEQKEKESSDRKKKIKAAKKKLKKRQTMKSYSRGLSGGQVDDMDQIVDSSSDDEPESKDDDNATFGTDIIATDVDKFKRKNVAMLRTPFDIKVSLPFRRLFLCLNLGIFVLIALIKVSSTSYYSVFQTVKPFNEYYGEFSLTSMTINFFALCLDVREIYYVLKNVVPAHDKWLPLVTVDASLDINSLFINHHQISLDDISESSACSIEYIAMCALSYLVGSFPFTLFSLILRDNYLKFAAMRIVSPMFGLIIITRAVLGPSFILKVIFSLRYLLNPSLKSREASGVAIQTEKTINTAINTALAVLIIVSFIAAVFAYDYLHVMAAIAFAFGLFYGCLSGCIHSLPIRPWMCLTVIEQGVWISVKKKIKCPCTYWGQYCTAMHGAEEVFIIFTTDDVKFINTCKKTGNNEG